MTPPISPNSARPLSWKDWLSSPKQLYVLGINPLSYFAASTARIRPIEPDSFRATLYPTTTPAVNKSEELPKEVEKLISNLSCYAAMKMTYEILCGKKPENESFYFGILEKSYNKRTTLTVLEQDDLTAEELYQRVYTGFSEKIDNLDSLPLTMNGFTLKLGKQFVKFAFSCLYPIVFYLLEDFKNQVGKELAQFLNKNEADRFSVLKDYILTSLERYFSTLNGVYDTIVIENKRGILDELVTKGVTAPENNGGYTSSELYSTFTREIIHKFKPSLSISKALHASLEHMRFDADSYFARINILLEPLTNLASLAVKFILLLPEKGLSALFQYSLQKVIRDNALLEKFLQERISSTHGIDLIVRNLLRDLKASMKKTPPLENAARFSSLSDRQKQSLENCVRLVFTVLEKSKAKSTEELKKRPSLVERVRNFNTASFAVSTFIVREETLIQSTITSLAGAFDTLLQRKELTDVSYNVTRAFNEAISTAKTITPEDKANTKRQIDTELDELLDTAIMKTLGETLQGKVEKNKQIMPRLIDPLQEITRSFIRNTITNLAVVLDATFPTEQASAQLEATQKALEEIFSSLLLLGGKLDEQTQLQEKISFLSPSNKALLVSYQTTIRNLLRENNSFLTSLTAIAKYQTACSESIRHRKDIQTIEDTLTQIQAILSSSLEQITKQDLAKVREKAAAIYPTVLRELSSSTHSLLEITEKAEKNKKLVETLAALTPNQSLLGRLYQQKHASIVNRFNPFNTVATIQSQISSLLSELDAESKTVLTPLLNDIISSKTQESFQTAQRGWNVAIRDLHEAKQREHEESLRALSTHLALTIRETTQRKRGNEAHLTELLRHQKKEIDTCSKVLDMLNDLQNRLKPPLVYNISLPAGWLKPLASRVHPIIKDKLAPALAFVREPRNYLYGIVHNTMRSFVGDKK